MSQSHKEPSWLDGEDSRAVERLKSGQRVNNPSARKKKAVDPKIPMRSLKGFRIRGDFQQRFDELAAREKYLSGKKGPDLMEEALEMLFRKYDKK